jgi:hypothetical protein
MFAFEAWFVSWTLQQFLMQFAQRYADSTGLNQKEGQQAGIRESSTNSVMWHLCPLLPPVAQASPLRSGQPGF